MIVDRVYEKDIFSVVGIKETGFMEMEKKEHFYLMGEINNTEKFTPERNHINKRTREISKALRSYYGKYY